MKPFAFPENKKYTNIVHSLLLLSGRIVALAFGHGSAKCLEEAPIGIQSSGVGRTAYIGISKWLEEASIGIQIVLG